MGLYTQWIQFAKEKNETGDAEAFWNDYFLKERDIYKHILGRKTAVSGTMADLAKKFGIDEILFTGFVDGINDSLKKPIALEDLEIDSKVTLSYDKEKLYYNMVAAKASWLYELPEWDNHLTEDKKKELFKAQKKSGTVVNETKVGRNDPCPCGSGKKYKKCCGK